MAVVIGVALSGAALGMAGANWLVAFVTLIATILFLVYLPVSFLCYSFLPDFLNIYPFHSIWKLAGTTGTSAPAHLVCHVFVVSDTHFNQIYECD